MQHDALGWPLWSELVINMLVAVGTLGAVMVALHESARSRRRHDAMQSRRLLEEFYNDLERRLASWERSDEIPIGLPRALENLEQRDRALAYGIPWRIRSLLKDGERLWSANHAMINALERDATNAFHSEMRPLMESPYVKYQNPELISFRIRDHRGYPYVIRPMYCWLRGGSHETWRERHPDILGGKGWAFEYGNDEWTFAKGEEAERLFRRMLDLLNEHPDASKVQLCRRQAMTLHAQVAPLVHAEVERHLKAASRE